jgi:predicted Zn-dependent peptidase
VQPPLSALDPLIFRLPQTRPKPAAPAVVSQSKLSNGIRVVSIDNGGAVADVGIFVQAGSRHESVPGTAHVLEHLAFAGTQKRSAAKLQHDADSIGATLASAAGREVFAFSGEVLREDASSVLDLLTEAATQPRLRSWEVAEGKVGSALVLRLASRCAVLTLATSAVHLFFFFFARPCLQHDLEALIEAQATNPRIVLMEAVHAAAFGATSAMGHSLFARPSGLGDIDADAIRSFLSSRLSGKHIVVTGVSELFGGFSVACNNHTCAREARARAHSHTHTRTHACIYSRK